MLHNPLPFTDKGLVEVVSERVSQLSPMQAWQDILLDLPYITAEQRAEALKRNHWIVEPAAHQAGFYIEGDLRVVAVQGGWWFRGVTAVESHKEGAKITYIVLNIAPGAGRWIAHLFQAAPHRRAARRTRQIL